MRGKHRVQMRALAVGLACAAGVLAVAPGASASQIAVTGTNVNFSAVDTVSNNLTVTSTDTTVTFTDPGEQITAAPAAECPATLPVNTITCTTPNSPNVDVNLGVIGDNTQGAIAASGPAEFDLTGGLGPDTISETGSAPNAINGSNGNDTINSGGGGSLNADGGPGTDTILGAGGPEQLIGGDDADTVDGGGGNDLLQGGDGVDAVRGGAGQDAVVVSLADGSDQLSGGAGNDTLLMLDFFGEDATTPFTADLSAGTAFATGDSAVDSVAEFEDVTSFSGADQVTGSNGPNRIVTDIADEPLFGALAAGVEPDVGDTVNPLGGSDFVSTGVGDDTITAFDGNSDRVVCGEGNDTVEADTIDTLVDCEAVTIKAPDTTGKPPDTAPDTTITKGPKKSKKAKTSFEFTSNLAGATFECSLNGKDFAPCTSPHKAKGKKGKNTFAVRAVAPSGLADPTPAKHKWTVKKPKKK